MKDGMNLMEMIVKYVVEMMNGLKRKGERNERCWLDWIRLDFV